MSSLQRAVEPANVVQAVEDYIEQELRDADKFENRTPLDESGIFSLHRLAAQIYTLGFNDGEYVQSERERRRRQR